jgi:tetratricopeptide (TPR) repeat protein
LAQCYLDLGTQRRLPPGDAYRRGSEAIQTALHLDQDLGEAHSTLGYLQWQYAWDWRAAERELRNALALNPNSIDAHEGLLWYLGWSGRWDETWAELEKIRQLDPNFPFLSLNEASIYYHRRDYKSLVQAGQKAVSENPSTWLSHYILAVGYQGTRKLEEAVTEYKRAIELSQSDSDAVSGLACAYAMMGRTREALTILQQLELQSKGAYTSPYMIAVIYSDLGERNKAFEFLEKAYQERSPDLAYFLKADLRIDSLRSDPRFIDLLRRMNFPPS